MLRIVNPVLHTKFLNVAPIHSIFLWWTPHVCADKWNTFLQFGAWKQTVHGAHADYSLVWKYPSFHLAHTDMNTILGSSRDKTAYIKPFIVQYALYPRTQLIGAAPPSASAAFTALNGLLPKNPL